MSETAYSQAVAKGQLRTKESPPDSEPRQSPQPWHGAATDAGQSGSRDLLQFSPDSAIDLILG